MKKIVIASDSYKGSVSSTRFADVCRNAILKESPGCEVICIPLGDGGEGTVEALAEAWHGQLQNVSVCDPLMRPVKAIYGISADGSAAIMEMAQASGLTLLGENERDPLSTTSYGTGEMIRDALHKGCRKILLGIGGSATNDGGMGMLSALGAEFFDINGNIISGKGCGRDLAAVSSISLSGLDPLILGADITVACDVDNPFCGSCGASRVFGRQKGADDATIEILEAGMQIYAKALAEATGVDVSVMPGAGAAGGVGGALAAALGARLRPGIDMVLDAVGFDRRIEGADLIITGEGRIDSQTMGGKTPFGVLSAGRRHGIPVVALGGSVEFSDSLNNAGFAAIFSILSSPVEISDALDPDTTCRNIENTVRQIIRLLREFGH